MKIVTVLIVILAGTLEAFGTGIDLEKGDFVLGFYSADPQTSKNFQLIRDAGINYVHTYGTGDNTPQNLEMSRRFLDLAQKYNLKVMFDLHTKKWLKTPDGQIALLKIVQQFKDHPALGMWYLYDEPKIELVPQLEKVHQSLRQTAPEIPTALVIDWVKDWPKTRTACDLLMVDLYPVRNQPFPKAPLTAYTRYVEAAVELPDPKRPVIGVMQTMNWLCCEKPKSDAPYRFPNPDEMRFMGFSSIALGVRGLFFYSFFHIHTEPSPMFYNHKEPGVNLDWYQQTFMPFLKEVKTFTSLVHPSWQVTAMSHDLNKQEKIYLGVWSRSAGNFIVLTNAAPEKRELKISVKKLSQFPVNGQLIPWGSTASTEATLHNAELTVAAGPWETFIWQIK